MAVANSFLCSQFMLIVFVLTIHGKADTTNFSCSVDSVRSCHTYVSYFAKSSEFMDLKSISNLFGVSALEIAKSYNLSSSENAQFSDGQLLLVPVVCDCNKNGFFANITYKIKPGDTIYHVSISSFGNLTDSQTVQNMNPSLNPNNLTVGIDVVFPLFCKCPSEKKQGIQIQHLITYIWQPTDGVSDVSAIFNVSNDAILGAMKDQNLTLFEVGKPIYVPVLKLPLFSLSYYSQRKNIKHLMGIIVGVALCLSFLLGVSLVVYISFIYKKKNLPIWESPNFVICNLTKMKMKQNGQILLPPVMSDYLGKPILYDYKVIAEATMNFNEGFKIGKSIYRATINGEILVVKEVKSDSTEELMILQKVNHINLVKLIGFSSDENNFYLVCELAENGSLDKWLNSSSESFHLNWNQRVNIALDVANGLQYLHDHTQPSIVHRDIKASCILLDLRFRAKISNLAKARPATGSLSTKVDVFAFGVVILELLSGKMAMECEEEEEIGMFLCREVRKILEIEERRGEKLRDWMDPKLKSFYPIEGALSLALMARACTQDEPLSRPSMEEIVFNLCVLAESSFEREEKSWVSVLEVDEIGHSHAPIIAR